MTISSEVRSGTRSVEQIFLEQGRQAVPAERPDRPVRTFGVVETRAPITMRPRWRRFLGLATILAPVLAAALFVFLIATPMFMVESRFVVRGMASMVGGQGGGISGFLATGGGGGLGLVDGYVVRDFLLSREAMHRVSERIDLRKLLTHSGLDPLATLPENPTDDQLYAQYTSVVNVRFNLMEQIVVLDVYGFAPADAVTISKALIGVAEQFVDQLSRRALQDATKVANEQVAAAQDRAVQARAALGAWRNTHAKVDPASETAMLTNLMGTLEAQLADAQSAVQQSSLAPNQPGRKSLELQVTNIRQRINETRARLAGSGGTTEASALTEYERLKANQDFADTSLASTRQSLDEARGSMLRQQKFLEVIAEPLTNNVVAYPNKPLVIGVSVLCGLALSFFGSVVFGLLRTALR